MRWARAANTLVIAVPLFASFIATGTVARADVCSRAVAPFERVDSLLEKIPTKIVTQQREALGKEATAILRAHSDDHAPPACRDIDAFELAKLHAQMHLLDVSFAGDTQTLQQRSDIAVALWLKFFNAFLDRHPAEEQRREFRARFSKPYGEIVAWRNDLTAKAPATSSGVITTDPTAHFPTSPTCAIKSIDAIASNPAVPDVTLGKVARTLSTTVRVYLNENGKVTKTFIEESSGVDEYDQATIQAAQRLTYLPAVKDCRRIPGTYDFRATFNGAR